MTKNLIATENSCLVLHQYILYKILNIFITDLKSKVF